MSDLTSNCPSCDASPDARVFVPYNPAPNDAQLDFDWITDLPAVSALVCTECGYLLGVIDTQDPERAEQENEYKVEQELE